MKTFPKLINQFLVYIQLNELKGKYRFYKLTNQLLRKFVIKHRAGKHEFCVPYDQWCFWKNFGPENYYLDEMLPFVDFIKQKCDSFDFIDLGADIGTVSALVNQHCDNLSRLYAFEPNPVSFPILQKNILAINPQFIAENKAVSDFVGTCKLDFDSSSGSDHEGHILPSQAGNTNVISLDNYKTDNQLEFEGSIVIKIDVEGQEKPVLKGAEKTIGQAKQVIILLELHPETLNRDNMTPEDIFEAAEAIRQFQWFLPLKGNEEISRNSPFYQQYPSQQYDVIGFAQ